MGANEKELDSNYDNKQVFFRISEPYYLGKYPITQAEWEKIMGNNPSSFKNRPNCPIDSVSWEDCLEFINRINSRTDKKYRLPTEAEWEYAAIGGIEKKKYFFSGSDKLDEVGWFELNSKNLSEDKITHSFSQTSQLFFGTQNVGLKKPNQLGLYDMSGNIWEWCLNSFDTYEKLSNLKPTLQKTDGYKVFRGGGWNCGDNECYVTYRNRGYANSKFSDLGFRVLLQA
jgi:formylglycine-generating enzyme required for sulfatase activity